MESKLYWQVKESEPRNKLDFLAGESQRADVSDSLTVALSRF
jgi:hypothetical protein